MLLGVIVYSDVTIMANKMPHQISELISFFFSVFESDTHTVNSLKMVAEKEWISVLIQGWRK